MDALLNVWNAIIMGIALMGVGLCGPAVIVGSIIGVMYLKEEYLYNQASHRPNGAVWRKRNGWKYYTALIVVGVILLHACFLVYYYYPWGDPWHPWPWAG